MIDKMKITISKAETDEGFFEPDYPIAFVYDPNSDGSMEDFVQHQGKKRWEKMHHEKATRVYYAYNWLEGET